MGLDKGIRVGSKRKFDEMLPQWRAMGGKAGKAFRRFMLDWTVENYGVTMSASANHYDYALKQARKECPEMVDGLGRVSKVVAQKAPLLLLTYTPRVFVDAESIVQDKFTVRVKKTGAVVVESVGFEAAQALINKAAAQKKAKLYFV